MAQLAVREVDVTLPRFKVTAEFQLKDALTDLGMPLAFSPGKADFSGIATGEPLRLSAVVHKAYVDVNEKGPRPPRPPRRSSAPRLLRAPDPTPVFRADHPFFFVIRDNGTGSLSSPGAWSIHRRSDESIRHAFLLECRRRRHGGQVTSS